MYAPSAASSLEAGAAGSSPPSLRADPALAESPALAPAAGAPRDQPTGTPSLLSGAAGDGNGRRGRPPHQQPQAKGPRLAFADHFWGKDDAGLDAVLARLRRGKQVSKEIKDLLLNRASLEEDYGKRLVKMSKSSFGEKEEGTLKNSLDVVRAEFERTGRNHLELAQQIRKELDLTIIAFMYKQREARKPVATSMEKLLKAKALAANTAIKAKEKYETECIKANGLSAIKNTVFGKEYDKTKAKLEKTEQTARTADRDYANAVDKLSDISKRWEKEWRAALDKFQSLEIERIDFTKETLWAYANILSIACVKDDEASERVRKSLELCDPGADIDLLITTRGTGSDIPEPLGYVNFFTGTSDREAGILPSAPYGAAARELQGQDGQRQSADAGGEGRTGSTAYAAPANFGGSEMSSTPTMAAAASGDSLSLMFPGLPSFESGQPLSTDLSGYYAGASGAPGGETSFDGVLRQRDSVASFDVMDPRAPVRLPESRTADDPAFRSSLPARSSDGRHIMFFVKCLYDYAKAIPEELDLAEGDVLCVMATQEDGWWEGEVVNLPEKDPRRRVGLFPSNFTVLL